jgi:hypothetical protein
MNRFICYVASLLLLATAAVAQVITVQGPIGERRQLPETFLLQEGNVGWARAADGATTVFTLNLAGRQDAVKNAPYTATAVTESTQTLLDGNRIVHKNSAFLARDSQGRTRREETFSQLGAVRIDGPEQKVVVINDPTSHTEYILNPSEQVVRVVKQEALDTQRKAVLRKKLEGMDQGEPSEGVRKKLEGMQSAEPGTVTVMKRREGPGEPAVYKGSNGWSVDKKHEDLGVLQVEGVNCQGKRDTITIPAGAEGNERPMQIVSESCYSEDLHAFVTRKSSDPRFGNTEYRLTNIKVGEPDASLFQVPANYKSVPGVSEALPKD